MKSLPTRKSTSSDILGTLWRYRYRCLFTAFLVFAAAVAYAMYFPPVWEASQALVVRDNVTTHFNTADKLRSEEDTKNTQQTLQEMVLSWSLLKDVLQKLGPAQDADPEDPWPSDKAVDDLRNAIVLAPPKGLEFGKTNVMYLKVKNRYRDRSLQLTDAIYTNLEKAFGELQAKIAKSEIAELKESVTLADENLSQVTKRLSQIEKDAGVDLIALRMLHQSPNGDTYVFRTLTGAMEDLRVTKAAQGQQAAMLAMLKNAEKNPMLLLAAPKDLLDCHPGLGRLIQGLSESRLRGFADASRLTEDHADMKALRREEAGIREGIRQELAVAIEGVTTVQELNSARRAALEKQVAEWNRRLAQIGDMRADYSNLVSQVEHRRELVEEAQRNLSQARAAFTAATASSVLSRMDLPDGGIRPISPSRTALALGGLLAGLCGGVGIVFLTAPVKQPVERRPTQTEFAQPARRPSRVARRNFEAREAEVVASGEHNG